MIAKLAYLTSPAPNIYVLNLQTMDETLLRVEISEAHLANIIVDGASFALRKNRVPASPTQSASHGSEHRP